MKSPIIGILAGMGPRSTSPFLEKVLDQCQIQYGASDDIDFPPIMIYSLPTPFYIDRSIDHDAMRVTIVEGLQKLEKTGVEFIAIPCNSAHRYYDALNVSVSVPLLHMIDIAVQHLPDARCKVAVLGTETTIRAKLYQSKIEKKGLQLFHNVKVQNHVNKMLNDIKSENDVITAGQSWKELVEYLRKNDLDLILSACTDLQPIVNNTGSENIPVLDAANCLAETVVKLWIEKSNVHKK